jgi:hypothetical protein
MILLLPPISDDLGIHIGRRQFVEAPALGSLPSFLQPIGSRRYGADKILDAHDHNGRLSTPLNYEALIVLDRAIHDLSKLSACNMCVYASFHWVSVHQLIDALKH